MFVISKSFQAYLEFAAGLVRWPDLENKLDDSTLWVHFRTHLYIYKTTPPHWEQRLKDLNEKQILLALDYDDLSMLADVLLQWKDALAIIRCRLEELNPNASVAFALYPHDDFSAMVLLQRVSAGSISLDTIALPFNNKGNAS